MFPLFGVGELVTVVVDAFFMALVLVRWRFLWLRTFGAWLAIRAAILTLLMVLATGIAVLVGGLWSVLLIFLAAVKSGVQLRGVAVVDGTSGHHRHRLSGSESGDAGASGRRSKTRVRDDPVSMMRGSITRPAAIQLAAASSPGES